MRLVILTGEGTEHRYVTTRLAQAFPDDLAAVIVARGRRSQAAAMRSYLRRYTARQFLSRVAARAYARITRQGAQRQATLELLLRTPASPSWERALRVVHGHNAPDCLALLRSIQPDVIAVYGTAVIRPAVIEQASKAILNMHTGLSPWYRGSDTIFWALHNAEPHMVGVTVHQLTTGIDSGPIVATARPEIEPDDDEHSLFAKAVRIGTELYVDAIHAAAEGRLVAMPQPAGEGREYRFVDRTIRAERRVQALLAQGLLREPGSDG